MKIAYCQGWFRYEKRATSPLSTPTAKLAFEKRKLCCVIVGDFEHPDCFIEFNKDYVGIGFFDACLREYLSYQFHEIEPGRLFLSMLTHRNYDGNSDKVITGETYYFKFSGELVVELMNFETNVFSRRSKSTDVSRNWESYPKFGQYESITRIER
jgi:hypothetical protein